MRRTEIEVDASVLSNLCVELPCKGIDCTECACYKARLGDELVLRVKRRPRKTKEIVIGS